MPATALVWDLVVKSGSAVRGFNEVAAAADRTAVATDRAMASTEKASTGFLGFSKALMAGGGVAVALGYSVSKAIEFQKQMTLIQTQAGASAKQVKNFSAAVLSLSGRVGTAPEELATSLYHAFSATHNYAQSLNVAKIAAEGAKVGNADLEETTNALTSTVVAGIGGVKNMSQAMGALNAIVGAGDMKLSDLNQALGTGILAQAKTFGVTIQQVGGALAVFGDNNIRGADAATKLRMVMQDLAKPAATAGVWLDKIHLSAQQLQDALTGPGHLTAALELLSSHMEKAGITGSQMGAFLENTFTKRAGAGLAILIQQMTRYEQKTQETTDGANKFGAAWKATTQTAAFQISRLGAEFDAAAIAVGDKLLPYAMKAAQWLGDNLPHAAAALGNVLQPVGTALGAVWRMILNLGRAATPVAQLIGGSFLLAWKALGGVLHGASAALSGIANWISSNKTVFVSLGTAVLGMWGAFKLFTIARTAIVAIDKLLGTLALKIAGAGQAMAGMRSGMTGISLASVALKGSMLAVGVGLGVLTYAWQQSAKAAAEAKANVDDFISALQQSKGAIDKTVVSTVTQKLATQGVYDQIAKAASSQAEAVKWQTLATKAALGNSAALGQLNHALALNTHGFFGVLSPVRQLSNEFGTAQHQYTLMTAQTHNVTAGMDHLTRAVYSSRDGWSVVYQEQQNYIGKADATLPVLHKQTQSVKALTDSVLKYANAELQAMGDEDSFKLALLQLNQSIAKHNKSLSDDTAKGIQNRQAIEQLIQAAVTAAGSTKNHTQTLLDNIKALQGQADKLGLNTNQLDAMLKKMHLLPKDIETKIKADTSQATQAVHTIETKLASIHGKTVAVQLVASGAGAAEILKMGYGLPATTGGRHFATGGYAVRGPGGPTDDRIPAMLSNGEFVLNARAYKMFGPLVEAINSAGLGFARGGALDLNFHSDKLLNALTTGIKLNLPSVPGGSAPAALQQYAESLFPSHGWGPDQLAPLVALWNQESGWNPRALNPSSGAYGIAQALPASKYASAGPDWRTNPATQIRWGENYIAGRYGSPAGAWAHEVANNWYADGGPVGDKRHSRRMHHYYRTHHKASEAAHRHYYHTHAGAQARQQAHTQNINDLRGGLYSWIHSFGDQHSERQGFRSLLPDLRKLGVTDQAIAHLEKQNDRLDKAIARRNKASRALDKAQASLHSALAARRQLKSSVAGATRGFFDITQAGTNPVTGAVTAGSMLAQEKQDLLIIKKWSAGLTKLRHEGLSGAFLRQLAVAGPSSWPQVKALLDASPKLLHQLVNESQQIDRIAKREGSYVSGQIYNPQIRQDRRTVRQDRRRLREDERDVAKVARTIGNEIASKFDDMHMELRIDRNGKKILARWVHDGEKHAKHDGQRRKAGAGK